MTRVTMYTDGSARGNPNGPGGYGTVIEFQKSDGELLVKELSQGYVKTTNNRMELMGVIAGFEALTRPCEIQLFSDSQYVVKAFQDHWIDGWQKKGWKNASGKAVKNIDLWKRLLVAMEPHLVHWNWVKGHNGNPGNERCDALATSAADSNDLLEDTVYENEQIIK